MTLLTPNVSFIYVRNKLADTVHDIMDMQLQLLFEPGESI